jgi:hypothetical protein
MIKLEYVGPGHIGGIPARDMTDVDVTRCSLIHNIAEQDLINRLTAKGLYKIANQYPCTHCDKIYKSQEALIKHELKHLETEVEKEQTDGNRENSI